MSLLTSLPTLAENPKTGTVQEIIGGYEDPGNVPSWMVALVRKNSSPDIPVRRLQYCGGVLVSQEWILTAAHCVLRSTTENSAAIIGQADIESTAAVQRDLSQIVVHPSYNSRTFENDVAMVKLASPAEQEPISLLQEGSAPLLSGQTARVYGWGQTYISPERCAPIFADPDVSIDDFECRVHDFERASRDFQSRLLQANIEILSDAECNARLRELFLFLEIDISGIDEDADFTPLHQFCAYDPAERQGVCFGDSGGPITVEQGGRRVVLGTASLIFGAGGCAREFATDVFTSSAPYKSFIDDVMNRDYSLSFESFCPGSVDPVVEYEQTEAAATLTRIQWPAVQGANSYTLRYSNVSPSAGEIKTVVLAGSTTELSEVIGAESLFYFSLQAQNEFCTGPMSDVLEIRVPAQ